MLELYKVCGNDSTLAKIRIKYIFILTTGDVWVINTSIFSPCFSVNNIQSSLKIIYKRFFFRGNASPQRYLISLVYISGTADSLLSSCNSSYRSTLLSLSFIQFFLVYYPFCHTLDNLPFLNRFRHHRG